MAAPVKGPCRGEMPVLRQMKLGLLGMALAWPLSAMAADPPAPSPDRLAPEILDAFRRFQAMEGTGYFAVSVDGSAFAAVICKPEETCGETKRTLVLTRCLLEGRGPCAMLEDRGPDGVADGSPVAPSTTAVAETEPAAATPPAPSPPMAADSAPIPAMPLAPAVSDAEPSPGAGPGTDPRASTGAVDRPASASRPDRMAAPAEARSIGALPGKSQFGTPVPSAAAALDGFNRADTPGFFALSQDGRYYGYANCPLQGQCEPSRLAIEAVNSCLARGGLRCALYAIRRPADIRADRTAATRLDAARQAAAVAQSTRRLPTGPTPPDKGLPPRVENPDPPQSDAAPDDPTVPNDAPPQEPQVAQAPKRAKPAAGTSDAERDSAAGSDAAPTVADATDPGTNDATPGRGMLSSVDMSKADLPALPDGAPDRVRAAYARFAAQQDAGLFALSANGLGYGTAACGPAQTCGDGKELRALTACLLDSGSPCEIFARKAATPASPDPERPPSPGSLAAISDTAATGRGSVALDLPRIGDAAPPVDRTTPAVEAGEARPETAARPGADTPPKEQPDADAQASAPDPRSAVAPEAGAVTTAEAAPAPPESGGGADSGPVERVTAAPVNATPSTAAIEALRQFETAGTPGAFALSADGATHGRAACPATGCDGSEAVVAINACLAAGGNGCRVVERVGPASAATSASASAPPSTTGPTLRQSLGAAAQATPLESAVASATSPPVPDDVAGARTDVAANRPADPPDAEPATTESVAATVPDDRPGRGPQTPAAANVATLLPDDISRPSAAAIDAADRPRPPATRGGGDRDGGDADGLTEPVRTNPPDSAPSTDDAPVGGESDAANAAGKPAVSPSPTKAGTADVSSPARPEDPASGGSAGAVPDDRPGRGLQTPAATDVATLLGEDISRPSAVTIGETGRPRRSSAPQATTMMAGAAGAAAPAPPPRPATTESGAPTSRRPAPTAPDTSPAPPRANAPDAAADPDAAVAVAPSRLAALPDDGPTLTPADRPDQLAPSVAVALQTFRAQPEAGFFAVSDDGLRSAAVYCQPGEPCDYTQSLVAIDACLDRGARNCTIYTAKGRKVAAGPPPAAPPTASPDHAAKVAQARRTAGTVEDQVAAVASPAPLSPSDPTADPRTPARATQRAAPPATPEVEDFSTRPPAAPTVSAPTVSARASSDSFRDGQRLALSDDKPSGSAAALIDLPPPPPLPATPGQTTSNTTSPDTAAPGGPSVAALTPDAQEPSDDASSPVAPTPRMTAPDAARIDIDTLSSRTVAALEDFMASRSGGFFAVSDNGQVFGDVGCTGGEPCGAAQSAAAIQACLAAGGRGCSIFASRQPKPAPQVAAAPRPAALPSGRDPRSGSPTLDQIEGDPLGTASTDTVDGSRHDGAVARPGQLERPVPPAFAQVQRKPGAPRDGARADGPDGPLLSSNPAVVPVDPSLLTGTAAETPLQQAALPPQPETPTPAPLLRPNQRFVQVRWEGIAEELVGVLNLDAAATPGAGTISLTLPGGRGGCRGRLDPGSGQGGWQTGRWRLDCALGLTADGRYLTYLEGPVTTGTGLDGDGRRLSFQVRQNRE